MNCGYSCQCQLSWPLDTLGFKRDPINSEKAWLDFTVRLLSREVVGKGKGQETVWNEKCKPMWWDRNVGLAWKNPTSNPKDTKEVLQKKYSALEKYLHAEGRFPKELEEEAKLWNEGKVKELYLQTTLTSLLGKVTSLHCAVDDACKKVKEMNAKVNNSLVSDITNCLNATLRATENFKHSDSVVIKRHHSQDGKENNIPGPSKCRKVESTQTLPSKTSQENAPNQQASHQKPSSEILAVAQKIIDRRRRGKSHTVKNVKQIFPKPPPLPCNNVPIISPVLIPVISISSEELNCFLNNNVSLDSNIRNLSPETTAGLLNVANVNVTMTSDLSACSYDLPDHSDLVLNTPEADSLTLHSSMQCLDLLATDLLTSCRADPNSSISISSNNTSPLTSEIEDSFWVSSNSSVSLSVSDSNTLPSMSPPTTDDSPVASFPLSPGSSSCENSLQSFMFSNENESLDLDSAGSFPASISPHFEDHHNSDSFVDQVSHIDNTMLDSFSPSSNSDKSIVAHSDINEDSADCLWEEDGSNYLETFLRSLG